MSADEREPLINCINKYKWYHRIQVSADVYTPCNDPTLQPLWDFILRAMDAVDFNGKKVLDVGCRDGLFSFEAEKRGAGEVIGVDNDLSAGATECLIPLLKSRVRMYQATLYDLTPQMFGPFDVILFFGVLYHLRYPVWGLKKLVDCLSDKGLLLIESGMIVDPRFRNVEFTYCPVEDSPYEPTSCTFFNQKGLSTTLRSLGCKFLDGKTLGVDFLNGGGRATLRHMKSKLRALKSRLNRSTPDVNRQFLIFQKDAATQNAFLDSYWNGLHDYHAKHGT